MLALFDIQADFDLDIMKAGQSLSYVTAEVLLRLENIFRQHSFDMVLVHGDTTTSFAAALAAYYAQTPVGHIEAGLRTHDIYSPFPEEANRLLADQITNIYFAPTTRSKENLLREGICAEKIHVTGNTVIDALLSIQSGLNKNQQLSKLPDQLQPIITDMPYVLITGHRRENFGDGFLQICQAIKSLATQHPQWHFVYPVHLNPNVKNPVHELLGGLSNVHLIEPVSYELFVYLMSQCRIILTDSGGVQEEAPSLNKPVLVMRDTSERPEAIENGTAILVGANTQKIVRHLSQLIQNSQLYNKIANVTNPYGDGKAAQHIVTALTGYFKKDNT